MRFALVVVFAFSVLPFVGAGRAPVASAEPMVFAYRAFVPAMASDSSPEPVQGGLVATHLAQRVDGGVVVTGEVVNAGAVAVEGVAVRVTLNYDGVARTVQTDALVAVIAPGGVGPFSAYFAGVSETSGSVSADVIGFEPATSAATTAVFTFSGPFPFQIGPPDPKTNVIPYSTVLEQLRGTLTNTGERPLSAMGIVVVAYDGAGNVAFVTNGTEPTVPFQSAGEAAVLLAGQTGSFVAGVPMGLLRTFEGEVTLRGFLNATEQ